MKCRNSCRVVLIKRKLLFVIVLFSFCLLSGTNVLAEPVPPGELTELENLLRNKTGFSDSRVADLLELIEDASGKGLPVGLLINKVKEGVVKKAGYNAIADVTRNYIVNISRARKIVNGFKNITSKADREYYTRYIGELFNRGLAVKQWDYFAEISTGRNLDIENIAGNAGVLVSLLERNIPLHYARDVMVKGIKSNYRLKEIERIGQLYIDALGTNLTYDEIRDVIVEGINRGSGFHQLSEDVNEMSRIVGRERRGIPQGKHAEQIREEIRDSKKFIERIKPNGENKR